MNALLDPKSRHAGGRRIAALAGAVFPWLLAVGCASTNVSSTGASPALPIAPSAAESAEANALALRAEAEDHFNRGKTLALSGDASCARLEFESALSVYESGYRRDNPEDVLFASQLYDSIEIYRRLADAPEEPAETTSEVRSEGLLTKPAATSPQEVEAVRVEIAAADQDTSRFDIPVVFNDEVLRAIAYFQFRIPEGFAGALRRSGRYRALMESILAERGLPRDLVYVAMVESAFKSGAHSRKQAHGFWQFIDGTAKRFGLRKGNGLDERSDPIKSTLAAAAYFRELYEMFGDWNLAMASYITGEGRVVRAMQRTGLRDYWELCQGGHLNRDTRDYVPFIFAAAIISKNPTAYGFDVVPDPPLEYDTIEIRKRVDLARIAAVLNVPLEEIATLNSELKTRYTPARAASYPLRVPKGAGESLAALLPALPAAPDVESHRTIVVRRGDTIPSLAARYEIAAGELAERNGLRRGARLRPGMKLQIPVREPIARSARRGPAEAPSVAARPSGEIRALPTPASVIASPAALAALEAQGAPERTAQAVPPRPVPPPPTAPSRFEIPAEGFENPAPARAASGTSMKSSRVSRGDADADSPQKRVVHTVKSGETLFRIATRYRTTVEALRRDNRLGLKELLLPGRRLTVTLPG